MEHGIAIQESMQITYILVLIVFAFTLCGEVFTGTMPIIWTSAL